jgi:hypothetical protein
MVPACYSLKEVQGYKMLVYGTILAEEEASGPREVLIWWRRDLHYSGMALVLLALWLQGQACVPLLEERSLSLDAAATCLDKRSLVTTKHRIMFTIMVTCLSLQL